MSQKNDVKESIEFRTEWRESRREEMEDFFYRELRRTKAAQKRARNAYEMEIRKNKFTEYNFDDWLFLAPRRQKLYAVERARRLVVNRAFNHGIKRG